MIHRNQKSSWVLAGVMTLLAAGLVIYSQTDAFAWDEGFHLLTAQLIVRGKRPYLDFNFPQTPLNAYWNAFWMLIFGQSWRTSHAVAALMTSGAIFLTADFLLSRFPVPRWRFGLAIMASFFLGLNVLVVQFGTIGQAYGLSLFLIVAAFRFTVASVDRKGLLLASLAGLLSSAAAGATLLTVPVCPVLALWIAFQNRIGRQGAKLAAFLAAAVIPFLPVLYLFVKGPRQTFFNIVQYNLIYRQTKWSGAIPHDVGVMFSWLHSVQAILIGLLALAGILFIRFQSGWTQGQRAEFYLSGWVALALVAYISTAHPTFQRYYLLSIPFLAILAAAGLYSVSARFCALNRPFWPIFISTVIVSLEFAHLLHERRENVNWGDLEKVAAKVDQVTPAGASILSDEEFYFLTRRAPPSGMELADSHKFEFPPESARPLHLVSEAEELRQLKAAIFPTAVDCGNGHKLTEKDFKEIYRQKEEFDVCTVFWDIARN